MLSYQTLLPNHIYSFLDSMAALYSQIERDMHSCLMRDEKINVVEKLLQSKYKVDSTTVRNVYHNLKGKHKSIKELRTTHAKELKGTIRSLQNRIKKRRKKKQIKQKDRFFIHQKKRRLAIKQHQLKALQEKAISLCFGTKKLFKAQSSGTVNNPSSCPKIQSCRGSSIGTRRTIGLPALAITISSPNIARESSWDKWVFAS